MRGYETNNNYSEIDDITLIFLDAEEYREELRDIEAIEAELQISLEEAE